MTILAALTHLVRAGRPAPGGLADDRGQASAPGLAVVVAVLVLVIGIIVTGSHQIIIEAIRSALDAATG